MELGEFVEKNKDGLQEKNITDITKHKIKYISDYVDNWVYSLVGWDDCNNINFIDCMCNAGVYKDCTLATSMEVLNVFIKHAKVHPNKAFNLFLNDYDSRRIEIIKDLILIINSKIPDNVNIFFDVMDVNDYIESIDKYNDKLKNNSCTLLFVDPYNFGTVKIKLLHEFLKKYYSELIFNYFSSDYLRNINNTSAMPKIENIISSMEGVPGYSSNMDEKAVLNLIQQYLKTTRIDHIFTYQFRTKTNTPLYSIVFATPNKRGLEKIKESYWRVFEGDPFYRNSSESDLEDTMQLSLFEDRKMNEAMYISEAKELLMENFRNYTVSYDTIAAFLLDTTMLKKGQILSGVIKPLIHDGKIVKMNNNGARDFLRDEYIIRDEEKSDG